MNGTNSIKLFIQEPDDLLDLKSIILKIPHLLGYMVRKLSPLKILWDFDVICLNSPKVCSGE